MASYKALAAALLLACCSAASAVGPSWYSCDPKECQLPNCVCASDTPPAVDGAPLAPEDTPQFIIITHDDAITEGTDAGMRAIIDRHKNRNGCNAPATFFVLYLGTDCALARKFWEENSELAIHSKTHVPLTEPFKGDLHAEMFGARKFLNETCGIPLEDMVGFRTPLLAHRPGVRAEIAKEAGMMYDSSIVEAFPSATSPNGSARLWPYTMDAGIPQDCAFFQANCTEEERYPGLWQVPLLETESADGENVASMDPGLQTEGTGYEASATGAMSAKDLEELLKENFDRSYFGNRSPYGLYIHSPWFTKDTVAATNAFLDYALALDNTWIVTNRQVLEWMKNPVPASQMDEWLKCKPVNITPPAEFGVQKECQVREVKSGDTGADIAGMFGVTLAELAGTNPGVDLGSLQVGQLLLIPPFDDRCKEAAAPAEAPAPAKDKKQKKGGKKEQ